VTNKYKYKRSDNSEEIQWTDPEDEHFMVWMRLAGAPDFRKLWGKIDNNISKGTYKVQIKDNWKT
jgi:hypothetical protein